MAVVNVARDFLATMILVPNEDDGAKLAAPHQLLPMFSTPFPPRNI